MMLELKFKKAHVPKIPDFVPEGSWITKDEDGDIEVFNKKPKYRKGFWDSVSGSTGSLEFLAFDRDALFGDLPPEQCCFQQKRNG